MAKKSLKTVALLARDTGLDILENVLLPDPNIELTTIFTHKKLTKKEGGGVRPELEKYIKICEKNRIKLVVLDYPDAKYPEHFLDKESLDLLIVLSWKFLLTSKFLSYFKVARINLHRGLLPDYKGLDPIKRMLMNKEKRGAITAHHITEQLDAGPEICRVYYDLPQNIYQTKSSVDKKVEKIKTIIKPLYSPLLRKAIDTGLKHDTVI